MPPLITHDIKISVHPQYSEQHSKPQFDQYVFIYYITIKNIGNARMQLLRRHWIIQEFLGPLREVDGEGVIGKQPILFPGEKHEYNSFTNLRKEIGRMSGYYIFKNIETDELLQVMIPEFQLIASYKLN